MRKNIIFLALAAILTIATSIWSFAATPKEYIADDVYSVSATITSINGETFTLTDTDGNIWEMKDIPGHRDDKAILVIYDNDSDEVHDDIILSASICGIL